MFSLQQNQRTGVQTGSVQKRGEGGVAQTMYTHVSKVKMIKKKVCVFEYQTLWF
jgi:hypothetical protein